MQRFFDYDSSVGTLRLVEDKIGLVRLDFVDDPSLCKAQQDPHGFEKVIQWLDQYFDGSIMQIDFPIHLVGTPFQKSIWALLMNIPYGRTTSYGELASWYGQTKGISFKCAQAIGQAVAKNPLPIIIPCHRVLTKDHRIGGYSGQLWRKRMLLDHEGIQYK